MKKITPKDLISFDRFLTKKLKNKEFKKTYLEEKSRLQLAYEIKMLRERKGMTQEQVAAKAKMPQSVIARIESGSRGLSITTLYKVARVFNRDIGLVAPRR